MVALHLDGSLLEGGGQILRNSTALSAIRGQEIQVEKIRAGRKQPGLSPQHLTGLQLVANISRGTLDGGAISSTSISFKPGQGPPAVGSYEADTKTAGSCTLMVQQALPVLMFAAEAEDASQPERPNKRSKAGGSDSSSSSHITLKGGTDAAFAPPIGYLQHVFLPTLKRLIGPLASDISLNILKRGFYPKGGGVVQLTVPALTPGTPLPAWQLTERGHLVRITGLAVTAGKLRPDIAQRMATAAKQHLKEALKDPAVLFGAAHSSLSNHAELPGSSAAVAATGPSGSNAAVTVAAGSNGAATAGAASCAAGMAHTTPAGSSRSPSSIPSVIVDIDAEQVPPERATGDGGSIVLIAETSTGCLFGASALAERGVTAEAVGTLAARDLLEELCSGAAVDQWMQDQLIIFMALAQGHSSMLCGELTLHTRTAISIAEQLMPEVKFDISTLPVADAADADGTVGQPLYLVKCTGAGSVVRGT